MKIRFSLSHLFLVTALVAILLGWLLDSERMRAQYNMLNAKYVANTQALQKIISSDLRYGKNLGLATDDCINAFKTMESFVDAYDVHPISRGIRANIVKRFNA